MVGSGLAAPAPILAAIMYQYAVAVSHPSKRLYVDSAVAPDVSSGKLGACRGAAEVVPRTRELVAAERSAVVAAASRKAMW
jgi:hypothetical protein